MDGWTCQNDTNGDGDCARCHRNRQRFGPARMRHRLALNALDERERQWAVCTFPLAVARIAADMRELMKSQRFVGTSPAADDALAFMECEIRQAYREYFGAELGQGPQDESGA